MIKFIWKRAFLFLLASMLIGAILVTFNSSNTFAQEGEHQAIEDYGWDGGEGGGGEPHGVWVCPDSDRCNSMGCNPRAYLDRTMVCSRWKKVQSQSYSCPSPVNCAQRAH